MFCEFQARVSLEGVLAWIRGRFEFVFAVGRGVSCVRAWMICGRGCDWERWSGGASERTNGTDRRAACGARRGPGRSAPPNETGLGNDGHVR